MGRTSRDSSTEVLKGRVDSDPWPVFREEMKEDQAEDSPLEDWLRDWLRGGGGCKGPDGRGFAGEIISGASPGLVCRSDPGCGWRGRRARTECPRSTARFQPGRRRRESRQWVGNPLRRGDFNGSLAGNTPGANFLAPVKLRDGDNRADGIGSALSVPRCDARIHHRVRRCKEHFHVVVQRVLVALRHELREAQPVPGRLLAKWSVRPIFGDHFLLVYKVGAELD